jgi:hypothetical protein
MQSIAKAAADRHPFIGIGRYPQLALAKFLFVIGTHSLALALSHQCQHFH